MKVLFCTNLPSPYRVDFFNELGKLCDLTVCYERKASAERDKKWIGKGAGHFTEVYLKLTPVGVDRSKGSALREYVKYNFFDIIIFTNYISEACMEAILYCKIKKISYCIEYDGGFEKKDNIPKKLFKQFLLKNAKAHFTTCDKHTRYLEYLGIKRECIFKYPFTSLSRQDLISAKQKQAKQISEIRQKLGMTEPRIVITVGRFTYDRGYGKGYDAIMKLAEGSSKAIGYFIIGDTPTEEFTRWRTEKNLTNVHFIGFKTKNELEEYYLAADIFILLSRGDIWGLVINEAMAYSLPIISTEECLAATELVKNGKNGHLVRVDNIEEIRNTVNYILYTDKVREQYGNCSFEIIQNYTIEEMAKTHKRYFEELLNNELYKQKRYSHS